MSHRHWRRNLLARAMADRRLADVGAVAVLLLLTMAAEWDPLTGGTILGQDSATYFYPMYSFLGQRLRSGDIPGWNPYQFSGAPFAADPQSGWMYLPAMLLFTVLPLASAAKAYMFFHLLAAGVGAYFLARALSISASGALVAGVAYEFTGLLYVYNVCCFAYSGVAAWLPFAILGVEKAIRSARWTQRAIWWGVSGLAASQVLSAWLGQGTYYAALAIGGYLAYRTLIAPPGGTRPRQRLGSLVLHGVGVALFAFGLSAAGLLPRLEYNTMSNLAGGYGDFSTFPTGGWSSVGDWIMLVRGNATGGFYAGGAALALAVAAPLVVRSRHAAPYFLALALVALILASREPTPLHSLFYRLLPGFDRLHPRYPDRIRMILYLSTALLAGASWSYARRRGRTTVLVAAASAALLLLPAMIVPPSRAMVAAVAAAGLLAARALLSKQQRILTALLLAVVFIDLLTAGRAAIDSRTRVNAHYAFRDNVALDAYYDPGGAGRFLLSTQLREGPFRYFGLQTGNDGALPYWADPQRLMLIPGNRATLFGLQDTGGYNPVHLARYDDYIAAANGERQDYWFSDIFVEGATSPLLDLLNARYIVIPKMADPGTRLLESSYRTAYEDGDVRIVERRGALPRAWIVHEARQAGRAEALDLLATGAVDPRRTALLERAPPRLDPPTGKPADRATVIEYTPDRIRVSASTAASGLLVLSEVYYPAWRAYVDGQPAPLYRSDYVLRAVPVPAGEHVVELRYESPMLRLGVVISAASYLALAALVLFGALAQGRRSGQEAEPVHPSPTSG